MAPGPGEPAAGFPDARCSLESVIAQSGRGIASQGIAISGVPFNSAGWEWTLPRTIKCIPPILSVVPRRRGAWGLFKPLFQTNCGEGTIGRILLAN